MSRVFGEIDLYLAGEGRHERLYDVLGAHVRDDGVSFAVWAPNARAVAVVGDFNDWEPTPMRNLGDVRDLGGCSSRTPRRGSATSSRSPRRTASVKLKADPFAFATEVPPHTASIVQRSEHRWGDAEWLERAARDGAARRRRSRSTRCTSARGGATRSRTTAR